MTLPLLSPVDTPIFYDMVIEQLDERFDEEPPCSAKSCEAPATVRLILRCCGFTVLACGPHERHDRETFERCSSLIQYECTACHVPFARHATWHDIVREVPL